MSRFDLTGKVVLITGAAQGIGLGTAKAMHSRGASVALLEARGLELLGGGEVDAAINLLEGAVAVPPVGAPEREAAASARAHWASSSSE